MLEILREHPKRLYLRQISEYRPVPRDPVAFQTLFPHRGGLSGAFPSIYGHSGHFKLILKGKKENSLSLIKIYTSFEPTERAESKSVFTVIHFRSKTVVKTYLSW